MTGEGALFQIRGKKIYVETHGHIDSPPLLYLHGGPGEGCYEFMYLQKERLSKQLYLIGIDQRGVWRSDDIKEGERFSLQDVVEDCEALRKTLGIKKWSILGHSFGGYLALLYGLKYSNSIQMLILECPSFDLGNSFKNMLFKASKIFQETGNRTLSNACRQIVTGNYSSEKVMIEYFRLANELGDQRERIYGPNEFSNYADMHFSNTELNEYQRRSDLHVTKLMEEGQIFTSLLDRLKEIKWPTLLIKGEFDPVTSKDQTDHFVKEVPSGQLKVYKHCGHLPHYENADQYAEDVISFIIRYRED